MLMATDMEFQSLENRLQNLKSLVADKKELHSIRINHYRNVGMARNLRGILYYPLIMSKEKTYPFGMRSL